MEHYGMIPDISSMDLDDSDFKTRFVEWTRVWFEKSRDNCAKYGDHAEAALIDGAKDDPVFVARHLKHTASIILCGTPSRAEHAFAARISSVAYDVLRDAIKAERRAKARV